MSGPTKIDRGLTYQLAQEQEGAIHLNATPLPTIEFKTYKRRWVMLVLFVLFGAVSSMSWIQYSIIANIIVRYYNVSSFAVDWTSIAFMGIYVVFIVPASYIFQKKGLRFFLLLGVLGTAVGSWIKVFSVPRDRFYVTFIGQTLVGMSQVFVLGTPPCLAAAWFGAEEISTACSLAVFGIQLGVAVGFLLPPILIKNHENVDDIGHDLSFFFYAVAGFTTVLLILFIIFFEDKPPLPPSAAQAIQLETKQEGFLISIKKLLLNRGYVLHILAYGLNLGVFNGLCTLLNQLILLYFPDGEEFAGIVGLVIVLVGMIGSVVAGVVLDKTHKYKETTVTLYLLGIVGMAVFAYTLTYQSVTVVYLTSAFLGFCLGGYMPLGFELAVELTYPVPESTMSGLLMFTCQTISFFFTFSYSWLMSSIGDLWSNFVLCVTLFVGAALTALIPPNMRRLNAVRMKACSDLVSSEIKP